MNVSRGANLVGMLVLPLDAYPLSLLRKKKGMNMPLIEVIS